MERNNNAILTDGGVVSQLSNVTATTDAFTCQVVPRQKKRANKGDSADQSVSYH